MVNLEGGKKGNCYIKITLLNSHVAARKIGYPARDNVEPVFSPAIHQSGRQF